MARIKYYDSEAQTWKYADSQYVIGSGGNVENGEDGFSPIAKVEQTASGAVISITDKDGTTTATITNGKDGADGQPGEDGYTPQKGIDYFDGQPGKDGVDGKDGYTPVKGVDYFDGSPGKDGKDGSPGKDGSNGVSATHSWNGTVLTITSASGSSSADLKGAKGDKGDSIKGDPGADGVSPTVAVSKSGKVTTISITDKNGTKTATINDGEDGASAESYTVPDFWKGAIESVVATIKSLQVGRNCVTFPFFSDNHTRNGYAGLLIAEVMKRCHMPYCFYGGDSISSGYITNEAMMIQQDKNFDSMMAVIPNGRVCRAVGNHDGYWAVSANEKHYYTREQVYELFLREESIAQNKHFGDDGTYYYVEDMASKVRFIVLNTNGEKVDDAQFAWFRDVALKLDEGWAVAIISHQPISNHYHANISNAAAVRTVVTESGAEIIGWFSGHIHRDRIYTGAAVNTTDDSVGTDMGFKQITITSDATNIAYDDATKHAIAEDTLSHAIDFVTINRDAKTVNLTRLGIGSNRVYSYDNIILYSITNVLTNVSNSNSGNSVESGNAYTATLTANDGYENLTVTVKMGGTDITSTAYNNGSINIASVTGDIVITATATKIEVAPTYTNLANPASADWVNDSRLSSSGSPKAEGDYPGGVVTNWIVCAYPDVIRVKGLNIMDSTAGYVQVYTTQNGSAAKPSAYASQFTADENGVITFTAASWISESARPTITKLRFSGLLTAASANDVIITKNEEIT